MRQSFCKGQSWWSQHNFDCRCCANFLLGFEDSSLVLPFLKLSTKPVSENLKQIQSRKHLIIMLSPNFIRLKYRNISYLRTAKSSLESSENHRLPIPNWILTKKLKSHPIQADILHTDKRHGGWDKKFHFLFGGMAFHDVSFDLMQVNVKLWQE